MVLDNFFTWAVECILVPFHEMEKGEERMRCVCLFGEWGLVIVQVVPIPHPPQINNVHAHAHTYFPHFSALLYGWGVLFSSDFKWHKAIWGTSKRLNKKQVGEFIPLDPSLSHSSSASHCILGLLLQLDGPCSMTPGFLWVSFACPYRIKEDNSFPILLIPGCLNTLYWLL